MNSKRYGGAASKDGTGKFVFGLYKLKNGVEANSKNGVTRRSEFVAKHKHYTHVCGPM